MQVICLLWDKFSIDVQSLLLTVLTGLQVTPGSQGLGKGTISRSYFDKIRSLVYFLSLLYLREFHCYVSIISIILFHYLFLSFYFPCPKSLWAGLGTLAVGL